MKKTVALVLLIPILILIIGAGIPSTKSVKKGSIEGTWELISHYYYEDNQISDTLMANENYRQIKMYYNGKVMWTKYNPKDSMEWFGYGNYSTTTDRLIEKLEFGSTPIMKMMDTILAFEFELQITDDTYSQINIDAEGNRLFSENYKRLD